jgi:hypothetical protein
MAKLSDYKVNPSINPLDTITYSGIIEDYEDLPTYETVTTTLNDLGEFFASNYFLVISNYSNLNFTDDLSAASGGVPLGGVYHTQGVLKIRIS